MRKWIITAALVLALGCPAVAGAEEIVPSVTVQGNGRVTVTPDLGTISFAITEEGKEAADVQKSITEKANTVKEALLEEGLPEEQCKTEGVQLYTNYDYSSGEEKAVGYRGQVAMSIKEISTDDIGRYLQVLSANGVNQIDGISVFYSGYDEAYNEALGKAMQQARQKAETLAAAEGAAVTERFTVTEGYQNDSLRAAEKNVAGNYMMAQFDEAAEAGSGLDFTAGTTEVTATVTVCYAIDSGEE